MVEEAEEGERRASRWLPVAWPVDMMNRRWRWDWGIAMRMRRARECNEGPVERCGRADSRSGRPRRR